MTTKAGDLSGHRLLRLSNVHTYGVEPVFAVCTCRFATDPGTYEEAAREFDGHTVAEGAGLVAAPWRETA